jgi:hypothetical protein
MDVVRDGGPPARVKWLVAAGCVTSVGLAQKGMESLWDVSGYAHGQLDRFWMCNGVALGMIIAIACVWIAPLRGSRWLRTATLLPLIHLAAIVAAGKIWIVLDAAMGEYWCCTIERPPIPSVALLAALACTPLVVGLAIKRRHGEWAHAAVMLSLAFLLLLALWLPVVCWGWRDAGFGVVTRERVGDWYWEIYAAEDVGHLLPTVVVPPLLAALAYTWLAFKKPALLDRRRPGIRVFVRVLAVVAVIAGLTMSDKNAVLYLGYVYLILIAIIVATAALVALVTSSYVASRLAHRRMRGLTVLAGTVADGSSAARFVVTTWLRGPRLAVDSFVVRTAKGDVPINGVELLAPIDASTAALEPGQEVAVLQPGDRVVLGVEPASGTGGPFRASELGHVAMVATPDANRYTLDDVALVAWRPAVAYLAILVVTALPAVALMLA